MTYQNCKVVLSGKNAIEKLESHTNLEVVQLQQKDMWFKTAYMIVKKPS